MTKKLLIIIFIFWLLINIKEENLETKLKWCKISSNYFYWNTNNCNDLENKVNAKIQYLK